MYYRNSFIVFFILIFFVFGKAQDLTVRNAHSMIYDSNDKRVLLFGGADEKKVYGDLWILKGNSWKLIKANKTPSPRTFASFVYDEENRRGILFGGNSVLFGNDENPPKLLNDTWELKGNTWKKLESGVAPEPRAEAAVIYDKLEKRIILFGGYKFEKGRVRKLNDTWEFKDNEWRKLGDSYISPRNGAALSFDINLKKIILFGGSTASRDYGEKTGETWILEGGAWRKLKTNQPANIFNSNMIFDEKLKRSFRFGGWNGKERISETWVFKNSSWQKLELKESPAARNHAAMVYDSGQKRIILFGGHDGKKIFGDLWIFTREKWRKLSEHEPITRLGNGH